MDIITTFAGNGKPEHSGDGGAAKDAGIQDPFTLAFDKKGSSLYRRSWGECATAD